MATTETDPIADSPATQSVLGGLQGVREAMTVGRVFGDAYELDGVTIIPVAHVRGGGGGGGETHDDGTDGRGFGTGFGISARPVGAYEVRDGNVQFRPAVEVSGLLKWAVVLAGAIASFLPWSSPSE